MIATRGLPTSLAIPLKSALLGDLMPPPDPAPSLSEAPLLKVEGVGKSYGLRAVLAEVSFTVDPGERLALTGPSGSGKTTLLNCIGGVDRPDAGAILLEDCRIDRMDNAALARVRRERIGTIFQFFHLLPTLTVAENVELPLQLLRVPLAARMERVRALLERVGLAARSAALPSQLSGGEQQRVAIARALVHRPTLLLADEPTGNLDSANGGNILSPAPRTDRRGAAGAGPGDPQRGSRGDLPPAAPSARRPDRRGNLRPPRAACPSPPCCSAASPFGTGAWRRARTPCSCSSSRSGWASSSPSAWPTGRRSPASATSRTCSSARATGSSSRRTAPCRSRCCRSCARRSATGRSRSSPSSRRRARPATRSTRCSAWTWSASPTWRPRSSRRTSRSRPPPAFGRTCAPPRGSGSGRGRPGGGTFTS